MNSYTKKERGELLDQALFLNNLKDCVKEYNAQNSAKIDMGWLINVLNETIEECENEVGVKHMRISDFVDSLRDAIINNSNLEADEDDGALFSNIEEINGYRNSSFSVKFEDGTVYNIMVTPA